MKRAAVIGGGCDDILAILRRRSKKGCAAGAIELSDFDQAFKSDSVKEPFFLLACKLLLVEKGDNQPFRTEILT